MNSTGGCCSVVIHVHETLFHAIDLLTGNRNVHQFVYNRTKAQDVISLTPTLYTHSFLLSLNYYTVGKRAQSNTT